MSLSLNLMEYCNLVADDKKKSRLCRLFILYYRDNFTYIIMVSP
jgi:hypothetical protein